MFLGTVSRIFPDNGVPLLRPVDDGVSEITGDPKALRVSGDSRQRVGLLDLEGDVNALPCCGLVDLSERGTRDRFLRKTTKQRFDISAFTFFQKVGGEWPVLVIEGFPHHRVGEVIVEGGVLCLETLESEAGFLPNDVGPLRERLAKLDGKGSEAGNRLAQPNGRRIVDIGSLEGNLVVSVEEFCVRGCSFLLRLFPVVASTVEGFEYLDETVGNYLLALPTGVEEEWPESLVFEGRLSQRLEVSPFVQERRSSLFRTRIFN